MLLFVCLHARARHLSSYLIFFMFIRAQPYSLHLFAVCMAVWELNVQSSMFTAHEGSAEETKGPDKRYGPPD
jgi:hypothetical protein